MKKWGNFLRVFIEKNNSERRTLSQSLQVLKGFINTKTLKVPKSLVDEFLLHKGHEYLTIIFDLETGHVLWLAYSKKKALYDFIEFVGEEWMVWKLLLVI